MDFKDYYKILNVEPNADTKEIKTAYRKLARKYHPDVNAEEGAEDKFKEVAEAYEVLKDETRRAEFDELRTYRNRTGGGFQPPPGWRSARSGYQHEGENSQGFSDFFNSIFGEGHGAGFDPVGSRQYSTTRGQDAEIELPVFLEDSIIEKQRSVEYSISVNDNGQVKQMKKHLNVKIPKGVRDGERIRLKGQGAPSYNGGTPGDLYLHIRLVPHPLFDVQGHNLMITVPLAPWEAALGTKITLPTLTGKINLTIARNTPAGKKLRIKGKGLQSESETGDLYAIIKIVMPDKTNPETERLWQELSDSAKFNPRADWSNLL